MPDDQGFLKSKVEALLSHAFESADRAKGDMLDPEDQAILAGIAELAPEDIQGDEAPAETDEETPPIPAAKGAM